MRNLFFKLFLLIAMLVTSGEMTIAQVNWTKYSGNPVIPAGQNGTWDRHKFMPSVLYNADSLRFELWYSASIGASGGWRPYRIGFATSEDGINWTVRADPVLTPGTTGEWDASTVEAAYVIRENGQYKMWYTSAGGIGYATSPDGINWTKHSGNPIFVAGTQSWEAGGVYLGCVMPVTGGYKMWYSGWTTGVTHESIGYATSTDGILWQRDTLNNPVMEDGISGSWDDVGVYLPSVLLIDNYYYMWYGGMGSIVQIGLATSSDGINWSKHPANPVLKPSLPGHWDDYYVEEGRVIVMDDTLYMWYGASGGTGANYVWQIGYATSPFSIDTLYVPQEYATIQAAIDAAVAENLVLVDDGTYLENINFKGKAITVASRFFIDGDESHIANTIINGSQPTYPDSASVVTFRSGEDTTSVICGFTITGGTGTNFFSDAITKRLGGGIFVYYSSATIINNIIESNTISHSNDAFGGGIGVYSQNANNYIIENNIIRNNSIITPVITYYSLGGGIYSGTKGKVRIVNNEVKENSLTAPEAWGGGILPANFGGGNYLVCNNIISGNYIYATTGGSGGIDIYNHSPVVKNNLIFLNSAPKGGGACIENASPIFANNIIAYNTATGSGGGLEIVAPVPELMNCIIWGNSATTGSQINGTANVSYSDVEGGYTGTGNLNMDPLFRDAANGDFHLQSTDCGYSFNSPCIDAGDPAYEDWPLSCDWGLGQVRSDMGAFGGMNSIVEVPEEEVELPSDYVLSQNYPNPFNPTTRFRYSIPTQSKVVIKVYDILGNEIATLLDEEKSVGTYEITWSAENLPSGVYFYQLKAGEYVNTKKMILLK
jgi:predicted GH43/DUF377 family glycosyl hydrolase